MSHEVMNDELRVIELALAPPSWIEPPTPEVSVLMVHEKYGELVYQYSCTDENLGRANVWKQLGGVLGREIMTNDIGPFSDIKSIKVRK